MARMQKVRQFTYRPPRRRQQQMSDDERDERRGPRVELPRAGEEKRAISNTVRLLLMLAAVIGLAGVMAALR